MSTYQSGRQIAVSYQKEVDYGELPPALGAKAFRINSGALSLTKEPIRSGENRRDGMTTRGRHGSRSVTGQYIGDLSVGTFDELIAAAFRSGFMPALDITETTGGLTSITTTANGIVASAGSWLTAGLKVGDVIRISGLSDAENNDRNLRIVGLTATTITVAETLKVNATDAAAFTITRPKKLIQGVTPHSFAFEQHELEISGSEVFTGVRVGGLQFQLQPNGMCLLTFSLVGQDMQIMEGAQSPYFTNPSETVTIGLTAVEAKIRLGEEDVLDVSSLDLNLNLNAAGMPVVGSNLTPDVWTNLATVEGTVTALKKDVTRQKAFLNEDVLSLHLLFEEQETGLAEFCSFFVGNFTFASASNSEIGSDGGRTQTLTMLTGVDERGGAFDRTILKYQTSAV